MCDFQFLRSEHRAGFGQPQFEIVPCRQCLSQTDWQAELEAKIPARLVPAGQCTIGAVETFCSHAVIVGIGEQLVAEAVDLIAGDEVEP